MGMGAFALGCGLALAFAEGPTVPATPLVALEREVVPAEVQSLVPSAPARPSRGLTAREMAHEAFLRGAALDGVSYFRIAVRARRRAPGDELLILRTIDALAGRQSAAAAAKLLRQLGPAARPLLIQAASAHPKPAVRARAAALVDVRRSSRRR